MANLVQNSTKENSGTMGNLVGCRSCRVHIFFALTLFSLLIFNLKMNNCTQTANYIKINAIYLDAFNWIFFLFQVLTIVRFLLLLFPLSPINFGIPIRCGHKCYKHFPNAIVKPQIYCNFKFFKFSYVHGLGHSKKFQSKVVIHSDFNSILNAFN